MPAHSCFRLALLFAHVILVCPLHRRETIVQVETRMFELGDLCMLIVYHADLLRLGLPLCRNGLGDLRLCGPGAGSRE